LLAVVTVLPFASCIVAVYPTALPIWTLVLTGVRASLAAGPTPAVTLKVALALLRPDAVAVIVAVPVVEAVKLEEAMPPLAAAEAGLNEPLTPVTAKLIALVAVLTVLPLAS
jgi:hypothetical protein